jgi:hypothetical protein
MTKNELLALANIGKTEIHGYPCEVKVYPSSVDGTPWLEIHFDPLSPLHQPLILGNLWVEYITEEDCAGLPEALDKYKREADEFCREAKTIVKATLNADGTYTFTDVPEAVRANFSNYPSALKRWLKQKHYITPIKDDKEYWYAPGNFTLELDGVQYVPHWSYWLDCAYYENTPIA